MSRTDAQMLPLPLDADDPVRALGRRVRTLRVSLFLTQEGLARCTGLSRDTIARLESGTPTLRRPRMRTVTALAAGLRVAPEQLLPDPCRLWGEGGPDLHA